MRLVLPAGDGLNATTCDRLLARLPDDHTPVTGEITVDLQAAEHVDPYGAASLCLLARHMAERQQPLVLVLPSSQRAQTAMNQMDLVHTLRPWAELRNLPIQTQRGDHRGALPLSPIRSRSEVQTVLGYLINLAQDRLSFDPGDVLDASKVVSELCYNVVDHSQVDGLAVAQLARDRQGKRYVALAVVDAGIGIRASLARRYPEAAQWRYGDAIQRALGGLSSRETGGGVGLRSITAVVRRYGGRLTIRSGAARVHFSADHQPRTLDAAWFPGTQVGISFSQR
ncbi:MAG: ATP-binding protein [Anaerolineae bacterium]